MAEGDTNLPQQEEGGIEIQAAVHPSQSEQILVRGRFSVHCGKNGVPDLASEAIKHIVLVVTRSANYQALTPFRETVVFEDDLKVDDSTCSASFNINVMDHIAFGGKGDYYILCSLGTHLSNILKVTIS